MAAQAEFPGIPFDWVGGVICDMSDTEREKFANKKFCTICGEEKELPYIHLSGGVKNAICEQCAVRYTYQAEAFKRRVNKCEHD